MHSALLMPDVSLAALAGACAETLAGFLSLLLAASALHKALGPGRARRAVVELTGLGWPGAGIALWAAAAAEALAAVGLAWNWFRYPAALVAASIWASYGASIAVALLRGRRDVDCGCSFGAKPRTLGGFQLLRSAVLVALALGVALLARGGQHLDTSANAAVRFSTAALAALALLALYGAVDHVMALGEMRRGEVR